MVDTTRTFECHKGSFVEYAIKWTGDNIDSVKEFCEGFNDVDYDEEILKVSGTIVEEEHYLVKTKMIVPGSETIIITDEKGLKKFYDDNVLEDNFE